MMRAPPETCFVSPGPHEGHPGEAQGGPRARDPAGRSLCLLLLALSVTGCTVPIRSIEEPDAIEVKLDSNVRAYGPEVPVRLKFFVDIVNHAGRVVDATSLAVELRVRESGADSRVRLRQNWVYRWPERVYLQPERRLTIPIVPERGDSNERLEGLSPQEMQAQVMAARGGQQATAPELPVEALPEGQYEVVAVVNERFQSQPYSIRIVRPDLSSRAPPPSGARPAWLDDGASAPSGRRESTERPAPGGSTPP